MKDDKSTENGDLLHRVISPFSVDVMDADFIYSATCTEALRKYARSIGHELTDVVINVLLETELDHDAATKAKEEHEFEIRRVNGRTIGIYQSRTSIRSNP